MQRTVLISLIVHIVVFSLFSVATLIQPNYRRLKRTKVTRVKFYNLPGKPKPKPVAPKKKKQVQAPVKKKVDPKPKPKKKITRKKEAPPSKPRPKPEKPKPSPPRKETVVHRSPYPPLPKTSSTPAPKTPVVTPAPPATSRGPLLVKHDQLPSYYLLMATQKIEHNFNLNRSRRHQGISCRVAFRVNREGKISDIQVVGSTGQRSLDRFAVEALERTETLGPLPDGVREPSIVITANFDYSP